MSKIINGVSYTLVDMLRKLKVKLAVAESLTGGWLSALICGKSGISEFYQGGVTSYTCNIKNKVLGVDAEFLDKFGPYNSTTTRQMCDGVAKLMGADIAVATSGVAGPEDDLGVKKGTAYITIKFKDKYYEIEYHAKGHFRNIIREEVAMKAYDELENCLEREILLLTKGE